MSTSRQLIDALVKAAENLLGRSLRPTEVEKLIDLFDKAKGTAKERARAAITGIAQISDSDLMEKTASSDDTDRIMQDLETVASEWKPDE